MRERNIGIAPQAAITKDNVSVEVSGNLYVQFTDPEKVRTNKSDFQLLRDLPCFQISVQWFGGIIRWVALHEIIGVC